MRSERIVLALVPGLKAVFGGKHEEDQKIHKRSLTVFRRYAS